MSRSLGVVDAVQAILPQEAAAILGLVTQLGDVWFLLALVVCCYWLRPVDRERTAVVLGIALATIALLEGLKALFGLPRPPTSLASPEAFPAALRGLVEATATAGGHGFPSGHATLSTATLLALAAAVRIGSPRRRVGLAVGLIAVIACSRVLLGVHFLVDVIAGVLVGLTVLAGTALAVRTVPARAPTTAFGLAVATAVAAILVTAESLDPTDATLGSLAHDPVLTFGVALGALAGWQACLYRAATEQQGPGTAQDSPADDTPPAQDPPPTDSRARTTGRALFVIGTVGVLLALGLAGVLVEDATAAQAGGAGIAAALVVALPALVPGFDEVLGGYVPAWVRGGAAAGGG